jgi:hypothetical protein
MNATTEEELFSEILEEVQKAGGPVDVDLLSEKLGVGWWTIYRTICNQLVAYLQTKHLDVLREFPVVPLKTRKGLVILPASFLGLHPGSVRTSERAGTQDKT